MTPASTYAPGPARTIVEAGPQTNANEEDEPAQQALEGDLLLEIASTQPRSIPHQTVKAKRCRTIVVPKDIPPTHFAFIQNVNDLNQGQRLSLDDAYSQSLRPLLVVSTIFATYSQHAFKTMTAEPAFWQIVEPVDVEPLASMGKGKAKAKASVLPKTPTRRPITTKDINDIFSHISDKVEGTFHRCKEKFRWSAHPDRAMWKGKGRRASSRIETAKAEEIREESEFHGRLHGSVWGAGELQKWDVPKGRRKAQGARYLDIDMRADLGKYNSEIAGVCRR